MKKSLVFIFTVVIFLCFANALIASENTSFTPPDEAKLEQIIQQIDKYAAKGLNDWEVPGMAVGIVSGDKLIYSKGFGVKKLGSDDKVTPDTLFQIGSTSKAFAVTLVGMLVDEGKLSWNDKVIQYIPDFLMYDPWVTREFMITDLMAQRSGLSDHAGDTFGILGYDRNFMKRLLIYLKPESSFRSEFMYQNIPYMLLAELIEKRSGKKWEEMLKERIFMPLGMNSSSADMQSFIGAKDVSYLHTKAAGKIMALPMDWPYFNWPYKYGPAGGINSNINDMSKWLLFNINNGKVNGKELVTLDSMDYIHTPKTCVKSKLDAPKQYYCQGWIYKENNPYPIIWHNGGTSHKTMIAYSPKANIGIIVLSNYSTNFPETLASKLFDMYYGKPDRDWSSVFLALQKKEEEKAKEMIPKKPAKPIPGMALNKYTGEYANEACGKIKVTTDGKNLIIIFGPEGNKTKLMLQHWDRDTFIAKSNLYGVEEDSGFAKFTVDPEGKVLKVDVDMLDSHNNNFGKFIKIEGK